MNGVFMCIYTYIYFGAYTSFKVSKYICTHNYYNGGNKYTS